MRVLIVDDEAPARRKLTRFVADLSTWSVAGEAGSVHEAIEAIGTLAPDLVLLDIQLGDGTGFDVIEALDAASRPRIVFVTAYDEHALRAFEVHAQDYLLKPVERKRFAACVERLDEAQAPVELADRLARVLREVTPKRHVERLYVEHGERGRFLPVVEIPRIEADRNYLLIHHGGQGHRMRGTLADLLRELDPDRFVQANRSTVVNLDHVVEVQAWFRGDRLLVLSDGETVKLSRSYLGRSPALAAIAR